MSYVFMILSVFRVLCVAFRTTFLARTPQHLQMTNFLRQRPLRSGCQARCMFLPYIIRYQVEKRKAMLDHVS